MALQMDFAEAKVMFATGASLGDVLEDVFGR